MIANKETGLYVAARFDNGTYMGVFVVGHPYLVWGNSDDPIYRELEILIAGTVSVYLDGKQESLEDLNTSPRT
jgi:hypothetical protein